MSNSKTQRRRAPVSPDIAFRHFMDTTLNGQVFGVSGDVSISVVQWAAMPDRLRINFAKQEAQYQEWELNRGSSKGRGYVVHPKGPGSWNGWGMLP